MGKESLGMIGEELSANGIKSIFMVTDQFIQSVGLVNRVEENLKNAGIVFSVFDGVQTDPTEEDILTAYKSFKKHNADAVLGLGGGSAIDTAKAVSVLARNTGLLWQYEGVEKITCQPLPVVAVPTTAGSGSEVTGACVITVSGQRRKMLVYSQHLYPVLTVLDPVILATVPPRVAAATGMDALTHAIEAYVSLGASPITDVLALEAIKLIVTALPAFVANSSNQVAAYSMQQASIMAAMAYQGHRLTTVHAMADVLSSHYNIPHGMANAVLLPHVMEYNLIGNLEKFTNIARVMGVKAKAASAYERARQAVFAVEELGQSIGILFNLRQIGVSEDTLPEMVDSMVQRGVDQYNPRRICAEDIMRILKSAMD